MTEPEVLAIAYKPSSSTRNASGPIDVPLSLPANRKRPTSPNANISPKNRRTEIVPYTTSASGVEKDGRNPALKAFKVYLIQCFPTSILTDVDMDAVF